MDQDQSRARADAADDFPHAAVRQKAELVGGLPVGIWIDKGHRMDVPVQDRASHAADALRTMAEADMAEMLDGGWVPGAFSKEGLEAMA